MNIFNDYLEKIKETILNLSQKGKLILPDQLDGITAEIPPSKFNSDISTNGAMVLSKINKNTPADLAQILSEALKENDKLIENISGKSLEDYFRENITGPLGMNSTWFNPPSEIHANIVDYHVRAGDGFEIAGPRIPEPTDFYGGGGGLMSSAKDYMKFYI